MRRLLLAILCWLCASVLVFAANSEPLLLQSPTLSKTQIAFAYGGDIWIVSRAGGDAQRLVTGTGLLSDPHFSPDGSMVAYTGDYDGNLDVYVVAAAGGQPRRLTYHPGPDAAVGWTPDGKSVLFRLAPCQLLRLGSAFHDSARRRLPLHRCPCPWPKMALTLPTGRTSPIPPFSSGSLTGSTTAAVRPRPSGLPTLPIPAS